jgi:hypothetical protein
MVSTFLANSLRALDPWGEGVPAIYRKKRNKRERRNHVNYIY